MERVRKTSKETSLYRNVLNTKVKTTGDMEDVTVDGEMVDVVIIFISLGALIIRDGLCDKEILYNTLFSREENFAKSEFEIFSREDIFANILFTRKYLPAKISSRENIFSRKYPLAKISSRENILPRKSFTCFVSVASFSLFAAR